MLALLFTGLNKSLCLFSSSQKKTGGVLLLIFVTCIVMGQSKDSKAPKIFSFPGASGQVASVSGKFVAVYEKTTTAQNDSFQYIFFIRDRSGNRIEQHPFNRSVEGAWSPRSEGIYINDFMGSTQIDCFIWRQRDNSLSSLTEILLDDSNSGPIEADGAKPPETPKNSRFELTCGGWTAEDKILVSLDGSTWAGGQFKYKLIFDPQSNKFSWNWQQNASVSIQSLPCVQPDIRS